MRGQARWSPMLVQRAVSEDPRWTRAVGDQSSAPSREKIEVVVAWDKSASRRARGWAGENVVRSKGQPWHSLKIARKESGGPRSTAQSRPYPYPYARIECLGMYVYLAKRV
jgi:hypothetical protein